LHEAVVASARLIDPTARAHSVHIVLPAAFGGLLVRANEAELQHVIINLLLNAIQASQSGGSVRVELVSGDPMRIRVVDHGCGIAAEQQARIFEPFFGLREGGTGLGLFLSLNFIRQWGGDITVSSQAGTGATFEVTLPAATPAEERKTA
jgi:signal transduction histidine kinase